MQINIQRNEVVSLLIRETTNNPEEFKPEFNLGFNVEFSETEFYVIFNSRVTIDGNKEILLVYKSIFKTDTVINEEFKRTKFPYVNAPSIAFAFLRAFIGNITMLSGFSVVMVPSINFVKMREDQEKQEESELKTIK